MIEGILSFLGRHWPIALIFLFFAYLASNHFNHGLNKYPGPLLAGLSDWWRFLDVYGRRPDITHLKLHRQHGDIVRLGPNFLSFSDPKAIKQIYGLNKGFVKVGGPKDPSTNSLISASLGSIPSRWVSRKANDCHHYFPPPTKAIMQIFDAL